MFVFLYIYIECHIILQKIAEYCTENKGNHQLYSYVRKIPIEYSIIIKKKLIRIFSEFYTVVFVKIPIEYSIKMLLSFCRKQNSTSGRVLF